MLERSNVDEAVALSAQDLAGESVVDDDGQLLFLLSDGERDVELSHEIGDPEQAALALLRVADELRAHAERIRYRVRLRTAGWT